MVEAERVTPASRTALLVGRLMRDLLQLFVQAMILIGLGYAMGMRGGVAGIAYGVFLTMLVGGACAAASHALALTTKSRGRDGPRHQHGADAGAAAERDPAADDDRAGCG